MANENKPPMFGTSAMFDPTTHEARSGKSALMNTLMSDLAGKPEALAQTIIGNCTTTIPMKFDLHDGEVANTAVFGPTGKGMSAISDAMIEEYKRRGATTAVVDKGPSLSQAGEANNG